MTHDKKLEKLEKLLNLLDEALTRSEFVEAFEGIIAAIDDLKKMNQEHLKHLADVCDDLKDKLGTDNSKEVSVLKDKLLAEIKKALQEQENGMNFIRDKVRKIKEGKDGYTPIKGKDYFDGKDANEQKVIQEVLSKIEVPKIDKSVIDETINEFRNEIRKEMEELKSIRIRGKVGGGFSKIAMDSHFVDDETPSGTINGVNKDFKLANMLNPSSSLKVYRGGARQRLTEDYTLSGKTITFNTAPVSGEIILCDYRH